MAEPGDDLPGHEIEQHGRQGRQPGQGPRGEQVERRPPQKQVHGVEQAELDDVDGPQAGTRDLGYGHDQPGVERRVADLIAPGEELREDQLFTVVAAGAGEQGGADQGHGHDDRANHEGRARLVGQDR